MSEYIKPEIPSDDTLSQMKQEELVKLGTGLDGVDLVYRQNRFPTPGTRAEKRASRMVTFWFVLAGLMGAALFAVYLWWPHKYQGAGDSQYWLYTFYTPLIGVTAGLAIMSIGIGAVLFTKKFIPEEIAVQDRHDGPGSAEVDRKTTAALFKNALESSTLPRRKALLSAMGFGVGVFGIGALVTFIGGFIKNPWAEGSKAPLWHTGWSPIYNDPANPNETVFLRRFTGDPYDVVLVKPSDLDSGGMETVFPWRVSDGTGQDEESREKLFKATKGIRNPVMLIRLRPEDAARAVKRKGQESFNYGEYWAYTKVCSHLGCPTSLYEQQTNHILCPCHQSQFNAIHWGKPVFGPAARALAQLPITVNDQGYLVANGDFIEPVGPAFWERKS